MQQLRESYPGWKPLEHISTYRGTWYDPEAVNACIRLFREKRYSFEARTDRH
ncbi:MAG TPA: hypothetical protein VJ698_23040 [Noviherbaspirillum sp.]|uniref:hypothetical protein n=1 Tax=Noviherbaspirillum sp. TaxID=1926288 RepID=UPI002B48F9DE|nr:hypothetical protein [Noviherbaspirillum sp.]HJV88364.1 hypothetical protein [Noviherbaspirillum sp.]